MPNTPNSDQKLVLDAINSLTEHFDSVSIFVTRAEPSEGGTVRMVENRGNLYATLGWISEWLEIQRAITASRAVDKTTE